MASVIFTNAQRIIAQVFQWLQTSGQNKTSQLITDTFSAGIDNATPSGEGFLIVPGTNNTSSTPTVNVTLGGIAYDPLANRIYISPSDTTLYNPSNVTTTTNDGLGNFISTPQSTGVVNVPVTQTSLNYIWVNYLATIDTSAFTLNEETNAKIFYKQTDGYNIEVTTVNVPPNANSIFLASVNMLGGGAVAPSNISQVGRVYVSIYPNMVPITTPFNNGSNRTPTYAQNTTYTLDAHIKSIGTGTGISPTNPHNMSLADLGVGQFDTVQEHRILEHGNAILAGIPGTPYPVASALAPSIMTVSPGSDTVLIQPLQFIPTAIPLVEFAIVNGTAYGVSNAPSLASEATINFPTISGVYNVYWDSNTQTFAVTTSDISNTNSLLWLATVTYTYVGSGPLDHNMLSGLLDRRRVGSTTHLLQRWTNNSRPGDGSLQPLSGEFGFNLTSNLLEYWDGSAWQQPVNSSSNGIVPTGALLPFAGSVAPAGFLLANGASVSTVTYPNLFTVIGYTYGGSGASFNLPNLVNNVPVGAGGGIAPVIGTIAGSSTHTLTVSEIPAGLTVTDPGHTHTMYARSISSGTPTTPNYLMADVNPSGTDHFPVTDSFPTGISVGGGGAAHSIVQPSLGVNFIIKY